MKIACIYWHIKGVGGINTELWSLRQEAKKQGDTFHVFRAGYFKRIEAQLFDQQKRINGGDTHVTIDGDVSYHPDQLQNTLNFLENNYDAMYIVHICPHANKEYGTEPLFLPLYEKCKLPKASRIHDPFFITYSDFGLLCLPYLNDVTVCNPAYAEPLAKLEFPTNTYLQPFVPHDVTHITREENPLLIWNSQWKRRKGIQYFFPKLGELQKFIDIELYCNGIDYYKFRILPEWKEFIGDDYFDPRYNGEGKVKFFGNIEYEKAIEAVKRSWYMCDFQALGQNRHIGDYGSYNFTTIEALYYGSCPILSENTKISAIPQDVYLRISSINELNNVIKSNLDFVIDPTRVGKAKKWVEDNHLATNFYNHIKESFSYPLLDVNIQTIKNNIEKMSTISLAAQKQSLYKTYDVF